MIMVPISMASYCSYQTIAIYIDYSHSHGSGPDGTGVSKEFTQSIIKGNVPYVFVSVINLSWTWYVLKAMMMNQTMHFMHLNQSMVHSPDQILLTIMAIMMMTITGTAMMMMAMMMSTQVIMTKMMTTTREVNGSLTIVLTAMFWKTFKTSVSRRKSCRLTTLVLVTIKIQSKTLMVLVPTTKIKYLVFFCSALKANQY
jgi:hypothetical protein